MLSGSHTSLENKETATVSCTERLLQELSPRNGRGRHWRSQGLGARRWEGQAPARPTTDTQREGGASSQDPPCHHQRLSRCITRYQTLSGAPSCGDIASQNWQETRWLPSPLSHRRTMLSRAAAGPLLWRAFTLLCPHPGPQVACRAQLGTWSETRGPPPCQRARLQSREADADRLRAEVAPRVRVPRTLAAHAPS